MSCSKLFALILICFALSATLTLAADEHFLQATQPRDWSFPRDHGRHDGFRTEWWYFTGNLATSGGRPFGFEITFFRTSIAARSPRRESKWAATDLYFAHAHVSDIQNKQYLTAETTSRARAGLAMAAKDKLEVVLNDWSAIQDAQGTIHLLANGDDCAIDLSCTIERGPIFQGPGGLSKKGNEAGQASYYYSLTRLRTAGTLTIKGESFAVTGLSWMDHEFSSNQLSSKQVGWDWICLQMNDGSDLMIYRMRNAEGQADYAFATRVTPDGQTHYIPGSDVSLTGSDLWQSPVSGGKYPQNWKIQIHGLPTFYVRSRYYNQELRPERSPKVIYYEGAAEALDEQGNRIGLGYLEMTGYAKSLAGTF